MPHSRRPLDTGPTQPTAPAEDVGDRRTAAGRAPENEHQEHAEVAPGADANEPPAHARRRLGSGAEGQPR